MTVSITSAGVTLDVTGIELIDASMLRLLMKLRSSSTTSEPTEVKLVGVGTRFRRALEVTGLSRFLTYETL